MATVGDGVWCGREYPHPGHGDAVGWGRARNVVGITHTVARGLGGEAGFGEGVRLVLLMPSV